PRAGAPAPASIGGPASPEIHPERAGVLLLMRDQILTTWDTPTRDKANGTLIDGATHVPAGVEAKQAEIRLMRCGGLYWYVWTSDVPCKETHQHGCAKRCPETCMNHGHG